MERVQKRGGSHVLAGARRTAQARYARNASVSRFNDSPRMIAQRKKLQGLFGGAMQLQGVEEKSLQTKLYPAQLNALAYAQGTDIHVAPGQEQHLPHEAWHVVQQAQGRVKPTLQAKGVPVNADVGLEREANVMGENALQHVSNGAQETKRFSGYPRIQKSGSLVQMKAGVESFTAKWSNDDRGSTGAGFKIDYAAKFKDGGGFSASDAEFRQYAADKWKREKQAGGTTEGATKMEDDHYSRKNDPGDYKGQDFKAEDLPGFAAGQLGATDNITWEFWADQYIVDTSNENEVIACIPTQYAKAAGADPREFSKPADKDAVIKR